MRRAPGAVIVGVGLLWALLVLVGPPAHAHTTLVSSSPADGARLDTPPATIELVFSEPVDARFVTVVVSSADGGHWEDGAPMVSETVVMQPVQRLTAAGAYSIAYRVVAADGHPVTGELGFTMTLPMPTPAVTDSTTAAATPSSTAAPYEANGDSSSTAGWTYAAIGLPVAAVLFAGGMAIARARSRGGAPGHGH